MIDHHALMCGREPVEDIGEVPVHARAYMSILSDSELARPMALRDLWRGQSTRWVANRYGLHETTVAQWRRRTLRVRE